MEVHHHTHTARQKFLHYFWEFFMLFLAVTLGFFVENLREHSIEHQREKQYMKSMKEDLAKDTAMITERVRWAQSLAWHMDTIVTIIENETFDESSLRTLYRANLKALSFYNIGFTERTSQQLKNAGGMRLIRKAAVADGIINYWNQSDLLQNQNEFLESYKKAARDKSYSLFNQKYYSSGFPVQGASPQLMTTNILQLTEFANRLAHIKNIIRNVYIPQLQEQQANAKKLMETIDLNY
jgi:hypothetical protein